MLLEFKCYDYWIDFAKKCDLILLAREGECYENGVSGAWADLLSLTIDIVSTLDTGDHQRPIAANDQATSWHHWGGKYEGIEPEVDRKEDELRRDGGLYN